MSILAHINPLTQEQRIEARSRARDAVAGHKPERTAFDKHTHNAHGKGLLIAVYLFAIGLLIAAYAMSAMRLFFIGFSTFGLSIADERAQFIAGIAIVLLSETAQIVFMLAYAVVNATRISRWILGGGVVVSTAFAIVGNWQVARPDLHGGAFAYLETLAPPLFVMGVAYILKEQALNAIRQRHANEGAYQDAVAKWEAIYNAPETAINWIQTYANAIRDAIYKNNARGEARKEARANLSVRDWQMLVQRELDADAWYAAPQEHAPIMQIIETQTAPIVHVPIARVERKVAPNNNGKHTGELQNATWKDDADTWGATCPRCKKEMTGYTTQDSARLALTAHTRGSKCIALQPAYTNGNSNGNGH